MFRYHVWLVDCRILVPVLIGTKQKQTHNNTAVATISLGILVVCAGGVRCQHGPMVCAGGYSCQHGPTVCAGGFRCQHGPTEIPRLLLLGCAGGFGSQHGPPPQINCNHFGSSVGSMLLARTPCLLSFMLSIFLPLWKPLPIHGTNQTGGWRQQIAARERTPRGQVSRCPAALGLLQEWGEGILSTVRLHGHCLRLQRQPDYPAHPAIARLAAVGNREGDHNSHTNLVRLLYEELGFQNYIHQMPGDGKCSHTIRPTDMMRLLSLNPENLKKHFRLNRDAIREFWRALLSSEQGRHMQSLHPYLRTITDISTLDCHIPITLHEDAGPYTKNLGTNIVSWGPVRVSGREWETKFVHHTHIDMKLQPLDHTAAEWDDLFDDFDRAWTGVHEDGNAMRKIDVWIGS